MVDNPQGLSVNKIQGQKLLFLLIEHQKLIYHATRWHIGPLKDDKALPDPLRLSSVERDFSGPDLHAVDAHIQLIRELDEESLQATYLGAAQIFSESQRALTPRDFPLGLSKADIRSRIRKPKMDRVEATLLSLGFLLPKAGQAGFDLLVFENRLQGRLSLDLTKLPLVRAFIEREEALAASELFHSSNWQLRKDQADTLAIFLWLKKMDYRLPDGLIDLAEQYHSGSASDPASTSEKEAAGRAKELNPKERTSLLQLIHALAIRKPYLFDPTNNRNGAITRIEAALEDAETPMSAKTIRKHLTAARDEVMRIRDKNL